MRKLILAAAAAIAFSSPVFAQPACVPLPVIGAEMRAAGITAENFLTTTEPTEISLYHKALGIELPDGVEPVGMLVVVLQDRAIVGLVQDEGGMHSLRHDHLARAAPHSSCGRDDGCLIQ